ncbi:hypothetical protein [Halobaculum sp. MBLA0143]|uniref:hypothetical protein n=1 Tax=Halobaculum sp. MBLA0143 TaxID=3079933 RepID=UPI003523355E
MAVGTRLVSETEHGRSFTRLAVVTTGVQLDFSKLKRDPEYSEIRLRYATPDGTVTVEGLGRATTLEHDRPVVQVVQRDDTTYTVPHDRVVEIVSVDL